MTSSQTSKVDEISKQGSSHHHNEMISLSSKSVSKSVSESVNESMSEQVNNTVDEAVEDAVENAVEDAVENAVENAVEDAVEDAVENAVEDAVEDDSFDDSFDDIVVEASEEISENYLEDDHGGLTSSDQLDERMNNDSTSPVPDTQFKGLIELMKAKEQELVSNAHLDDDTTLDQLHGQLETEGINPHTQKLFEDGYLELKEQRSNLKQREESLALSLQIAREGLETQRRELDQQQRTLQAQQNAIFKSMQTRERLLEEKEVSFQRKVEGLNQKTSKQEKYHKVLVAREEQLNQRQSSLEEEVTHRSKEASKHYKDEFQERCTEAELDFDKRHNKLEARYREKLSQLNEQRSQLEEHIQARFGEAQAKLRNQLEEQRGALNLSLEVEREALESRKVELERLFTSRLNNLESREQLVEQASSRFIEERQSLSFEQDELKQLKSDLAQRSQQLKDSSIHFKTMLSQAKRDRDAQSEIRGELEARKSELDARDKTLTLKSEEITQEREALYQKELEVSRLHKQSGEELESAQQSRERAIRLEGESEQRAKLVKKHLAEVTRREATLSELEHSVSQRSSELEQLIESASTDQDHAHKARVEAQALREDAQRLHEMRSKELEEAERGKGEKGM